MKQIKYLNAVLTVIAFCLVLITCAVTGLIPSVSAKEPDMKFIKMPLNPDGSLNIKFAPDVVDVNIIGVSNNRISTLDPRLPVYIAAKKNQ